MKLSNVKNQRGQTLIEYLIIVSLLGVGSIVIMSKVGQQLNGRFAKVIESLGGTVQSGADTKVLVSKKNLDRKNLSDFDDKARTDLGDASSKSGKDN